MKRSVLLALVSLTLGVAPALAQAPATAPAQTPAAAPAAVAPAVQPVFPQGSKVAYVNLQSIMQESADGKAATAKLTAENAKKKAELEGKLSKMQSDDQRLKSGGALMAAEAREKLEKDIERQRLDGERFEQDANAEMQELQARLVKEVQEKMFPLLEKMAKDKGLLMLYSAADSGLIWGDPALNLTAEAVKLMDAAPAAKPAPAPEKPAATTKPAPPASTQKPATTKP